MLIGVIGVISVAFAGSQWFGYSLWHTYGDRPTGLFYSPLVAGGFLGLAVVACGILRWWVPMPALALGLYLAGNRGGWVCAAFGLLAIWVRKPLVLLTILLAGAFLVTWNPSLSDLERLNIWYTAWVNLSLFGNGWGSFTHVWIVRDGLGFQPVYAHNDYIQLVFEFGLYALPVFCVLAYALWQTEAEGWPLLVAYCVLATFSFPSFVLPTACIGLLAFVTTIGAKHG